MSRTWDGRLSKLELNGDSKNGHGCCAAKFVLHPATVQDLDRLFDELNGQPREDEPESDSRMDPQTEVWLNELYDDILELEKKRKENHEH
jgi:hypothetical protein